MPLGTELSIGPGEIVLDEDPARPLKGGTAPPLPAHVYCQSTGWIKIQDASWYEGRPQPGHIVLDGDAADLLLTEPSQSPPKKA